MSFRPPSLQNTYNDFCSLDPAIIQPPEPPAEGEPRDEYQKEVELYLDKLRVARETGDWSAILVPDKTPAKFVMRPIAGSLFRELMDLVQGDKVGAGMMHQLAFRAAVQKVVDPELDERMQVKHATHPMLGKIATAAISDYLDSIDLRIVTELGGEALRRARELSPKS